VRLNAQRKANTAIPKLITRENIPRNKKRISLKIPKPIGNPRRIEISGLFYPFVTISIIIPRISAFKIILSSICFLRNNKTFIFIVYYSCRLMTGASAKYMADK